jgi:hypothetical protein
MNSYLESMKYNLDVNQVGAGYPMTEFIKMDNFNRSIIEGGSKNKVGKSRFEDLVIPISIDSHSMGEPAIKQIGKISKKIEVISDDLFNKLFEKTGKLPSMKTNTTRSHRYKNKPTRKST